MDYSYPPPNNEWAFEDFCQRLLRVHWQGADPQRYGTRDSPGWRRHNRHERGGASPCSSVQAQRIRGALTRAEISGDVEKAKGFQPPIGLYYVLTTSKRSTELQKVVLDLNKAHQRQGLFRIILLTWDMIEEILREHPGLCDQALDPPLMRALEPVMAMLTVIGQRQETLLPQQIDDEFDKKLEFARKLIDEHNWQAQRSVCVTTFKRLAIAFTIATLSDAYLPGKGRVCRDKLD